MLSESIDGQDSPSCGTAIDSSFTRRVTFSIQEYLVLCQRTHLACAVLNSTMLSNTIQGPAAAQAIAFTLLVLVVIVLLARKLFFAGAAAEVRKASKMLFSSDPLC
jgi:hypothetical protein